MDCVPRALSSFSLLVRYKEIQTDFAKESWGKSEGSSCFQLLTEPAWVVVPPALEKAADSIFCFIFYKCRCELGGPVKQSRKMEEVWRRS